jgi:hypothetical protein
MLARLLSAPVAACLVLSLASAAFSQDAPPPFHPLVDYHQHLASPEGVKLLNRAQPPVELPADIASMMSRMVEHWNQPEALADLYTSDAVALANLNKPLDAWIKGRAEVSRYTGGVYGRPHHAGPVRRRR